MPRAWQISWNSRSPPLAPAAIPKAISPPSFVSASMACSMAWRAASMLDVGKPCRAFTTAAASAGLAAA
jgi:hypothetical protein